MNIQNTKVNEEQVIYAKVLEVGMYIGLAILFITFALYVFRIMEPAIPLEHISSLWSQPVHDYLEEINHNFLHLDKLPTGWTWVTLLHYADFLNFVGIALLSGVTIVSFLSIIPVLLRKGDKVYAVMALAEALILGLAASGILQVGH